MFKKYKILASLILLTNGLVVTSDRTKKDKGLDAELIADLANYKIKYTKKDVNNIYANPYFRAGSMLSIASLCTNFLLNQDIPRNRDISAITDYLLTTSLIGLFINDIKYGTIHSGSFVLGVFNGGVAFISPLVGDISVGCLGFTFGCFAGYLGGINKKLINPETNLNRWIQNGGVAGAHFGSGFGFAAGTVHSINILMPEVGNALSGIRKKPNHTIPSEELK